MLSYAYLIALLALTSLLLVADYRLRLAFFSSWQRTIRVIVPAFMLFVFWDLAGIQLGIFYPGPSRFTLQLFIVPKFPLEELVFLLNFVYLTLLLWICEERYVHVRHT